MKQTTLALFCSISLVVSFAACTTQTPPQPVTETNVIPTESPVLPAEVVKPTATPEPTATPNPTATPEPTATLVPINFVLTILDEGGNPLPQVNVQNLSESDTVIQTDQKGQITWTNLNSDSNKIIVNAPGYKTIEKDYILNRGENTAIFKLEEEPYGIKTSSACGPGETPVYIEDLQDKIADNWPEIDAGAMGWSVMEKPDEPGNFVIAASGSKDVQPPPTDLKSDQKFNNAVWRTRVWFEGKPAISTFLNWRHSFDTGDVRYFTHFGPQVYVDLTRFDSGNGIPVGRTGSAVSVKKWHYFEISFYNGNIQVWMDGKKMIVYEDKEPFPAGTIGLEPHFNADGVIYYDNLVVCELNGPFVTLPLPTPANK